MALTAAEAARRLNRTERTIRRWIATGELQAFHPTHGRKDKYLLEESEVERLAGELATYEQPKPGPAATMSEDVTKRLEKVEHWLSDLQRWHSELEQRIDALEHSASVENDKTALRSLQGHTEAPRKKPGRPAGSFTAEPPKEIPQDSVGYAAFAEQHGVNERTARDQIDKGYVPAFVRARPSNPRFKERWLRPEDQQAAIQFWQSRETSGFRTCPDCPHT